MVFRSHGLQGASAEQSWRLQSSQVCKDTVWTPILTHTVHMYPIRAINTYIRGDRLSSIHGYLLKPVLTVTILGSHKIGSSMPGCWVVTSYKWFRRVLIEFHFRLTNHIYQNKKITVVVLIEFATSSCLYCTSIWCPPIAICLPYSSIS